VLRASEETAFGRKFTGQGATRHSTLLDHTHASTPRIAMQKVVQRRIAAEHQALRRAAKQKSKVDNAKEWNARYQNVSRNKAETRYFLEEKFRRREEYEVGPLLAPRRDTGHLKDTYGVIDPAVIQTSKLHWTMYKHFKSPFAVGDRVLVTKGKDAGKIGTLSEVLTESGFVRINELRKVHLHNSPPLSLPLLTPNPRPTFSFPNTYARKTRILAQSYNNQCPSAGRTSSSSSPFATRPMVTLKTSFWKRSTCATLDG
jgi:hypothetical protein